MGNDSHQSKQKQQTLRTGLQEEKTSDVAQEEHVRLSTEQAELFKRLLRAMTEAQNNLNFALLAANINGESIIGGNLDGDTPHFVVRNTNGQEKS